MSVTIKKGDCVILLDKYHRRFRKNQQLRIVDKIGSYAFYAEDLNNDVHDKVYRYSLWKNPIEKLKLI